MNVVLHLTRKIKVVLFLLKTTAAADIIMISVTDVVSVYNQLLF